MHSLPRVVPASGVGSKTVIALLAMTAIRIHISNSNAFTNTASRSRRGFRARFALKSCPLKFRGRRECRAHNAPADGVTGSPGAFQASRASYGAVYGARRAACLEDRRSSLTLMV